MKIDANGLLSLLVLSVTFLGGWIAYLKVMKPEKKRCAELEEQVKALKEDLDNYKKKFNRYIKEQKKKSSFN